MAIDSTLAREYLCSAKYKDVCSLVTTPLFVNRRSFHSARQSCVTNLSRPDKPVSLIIVKPSRPLRGGNKQRKSDIKPVIRWGAVLPAAHNWLLMTGAVERAYCVGVTNSLSLDRLWREGMELKLITQQQIGLNQKALDEWIEYRRKYSKKPMSQPAVDKVISKLLQWSESEQQRMVDEAIEHEWTGLHYVEPPKQITTRNTSIRDDLTDTSWAN